jgi:hypothetical protein
LSRSEKDLSRNSWSICSKVTCMPSFLPFWSVSEIIVTQNGERYYWVVRLFRGSLVFGVTRE